MIFTLFLFHIIPVLQQYKITEKLSCQFEILLIRSYCCISSCSIIDNTSQSCIDSSFCLNKVLLSTINSHIFYFVTSFHELFPPMTCCLFVADYVNKKFKIVENFFIISSLHWYHLYICQICTLKLFINDFYQINNIPGEMIIKF